LPQLSELRTEEPDYAAQQTSSDVPLDEAKWRKAAAALLKKKAKLETQLRTAEEKCQLARDQLIVPLKRKEITFVDPSEEPASCVKAEELRVDVTQISEEWNDFTENARKAGVPWSWLE
jgi:hypothetical protein